MRFIKRIFGVDLTTLVKATNSIRPIVVEKCIEEKVIPAVITKRDEFADVDLVLPWRTPFKITRSEHGHLRPWYVRHPETQEEIRVTCEKIDYHGHSRLPYFITFQRYIVG